MTDLTKLCLLPNNVFIRDWPCGICGRRFNLKDAAFKETDHGTLMLQTENEDLVCDDCGDKYAPHLMAEMRQYHLRTLTDFQLADMDYGGCWAQQNHTVIARSCGCEDKAWSKAIEAEVLRRIARQWLADMRQAKGNEELFAEPERPTFGFDDDLPF